MTRHPASRWSYWLFLTVMMLESGALLGTGLHALHQNHQFAVKAERTEGMVIQKDDNVSLGHLEGSKRTCYLAYTYRVAGTSYSTPEQIVGEQTWREAKLDGLLPIKYLADNPFVSRIALTREEELDATHPRLPLMLGVALMLGCIVVVRQRARKIRLVA